MTTKNWLAQTDNWNTAVDWSGGTLPSAGDDVVIAHGQPEITTSITPVNSISITGGGFSAELSTSNYNGVLTTGDLTNAGTVNIDSGSQSIGGTLVNSGTVTFYEFISSAALTVNAVNNTGTIEITGEHSFSATLNVLAAAPAALTGMWTIEQGVLEFASGSISTIGGTLTLVGSQAFIADAGQSNSNSALALTSNTGFLKLQNGALLSTPGGFANGNELDINGGTFTVGGALTNSGTVNIGVNSDSSSNVSAAGLVNTSSINIGTAGFITGTATHTLDIATAAPSVLTGRYHLNGYHYSNASVTAILEFTSGGIASIASGAELHLAGAFAFVANGSNLNNNSALTTLSSNAGTFELRDGASLSLAALNNTGFVTVDASYYGESYLPGGGSALTIAGILTNSGTFNVGSVDDSKTVNVSVGSLINTGTLNVGEAGETFQGGTEAQATFNVASTAPSALSSGAIHVGGNAVLKFAGGGINSIGSGADLELRGPQAFVVSGANTTSNSALTGLALNAGKFLLADGAVVSTTGSLTNIGELDVWGQSGAASSQTSLSVGGTLINFGTTNVDTADGGYGSMILNAAGLANYGVIYVSGHSSQYNNSQPAILNIGSAAPSILTGSVNVGKAFPYSEINGPALLEFASGSIWTIGVGAYLGIKGAQAFIADSAQTGSSSALTGLSVNAGSIQLDAGASIATTTNFVNFGTIELDHQQTGSSNLSVGGALTNVNSIVIGANSSNGPSTMSATGLTNFGTVRLEGSSSTNSGSLTINGNAANLATMTIDPNSKVNVTGTYTQTAGLTSINSPLIAGNVALRGGTIDVNTGLTAASVALTGGLLQGAGTITGNVSNTGGMVIGGTVSDAYSYRFGFFNPGAPGTLTINGNFAETNSALVEVLRDVQGSQHISALDISGSVSLQGGALQVDADRGNDTNGLVPAAGMTFTVMSFAPGGLTGTFANIQDGPFIGLGNSVNIGGGLTLQVVYNSSNIQLNVINTPTTGDHWVATTPPINDLLWWDVGANWAGGVPGSSADAVIDVAGNYTVYVRNSLTVGSLAIANTGAGFAIDSQSHLLGNSFETGILNVAVTGNLTNAGSIAVDNNGPYQVDGGSTLAVGGTLANGGAITIGTGGTNSNVQAGALINTGAINFNGGGWTKVQGNYVPGGHVDLVVAGAAGFGTPGTLTGTVSLHGDALLQFGSGQITQIANGGALTLASSRVYHHANAVSVLHSLVADSSDPTTNSALADLTRIGGSYGTGFILLDGTSVTTAVDLTNAGYIAVDYNGPYAVTGGSTLNVGGALTTLGTINIGGGGIIFDGTLAAASLTSVGTINLHGGDLQTDMVDGVAELHDGRATLNIAGAAGFGTVGTLTGHVDLSGVALMEFGNGQITSIASGASLTITGTHAFVADASAPTSNSALAGLASIGGGAVLRLLGGADMTTTGDLWNAGGFSIDENGPYGAPGGTSVTLGGVLTNSGGLYLGTPSISSDTSLTVAGLIDTGSITLTGGDGQNGHFGHAIMTVNGAATNDGTLTAYSGADLMFGGAVANFGNIQALGGVVDFDGDVTGTGGLTFSSGGMVTFESAHVTTNTIYGFGLGSTIDLAGIGFDPSASVHLLSGNVLEFVENNQTYDLNFNPNQNFGSLTFKIANNGSAGTEISLIGTANDFDADGKADILWRNTDGTVATWKMNGGSISAANFLPGVSSDWHIEGRGDFDGDGKSDVLWVNDSGAVITWQMNSSAQIGSTPGLGTAPANAPLAGIGDVDGDGRSDILWRDSTTGAVTIWTAGAHTTIAGVGNDWGLVGVGDFNGDGKDDVLFRHISDGIVAYWQMAGSGTGGAAVTNTMFLNGVPADWHVVGTGDFDGNGSSDVLWHDDNGANAVWLMDNTGQIQQAAFFNGVSSDWHVAGTGDFNADGKDDVVWRNDAGATAIWTMNGANTPTVSFPGGVPVQWTIQDDHYQLV